MNRRAFGLLLSPLYEGALAPEHRADLRKSGLTPETIRMQRLLSVPPSMIDTLLGFPTPKVSSAYILPYPDPAGGWLNHIRLKVFPSYTDRHGRTVKYLGPKGAPPRLFFCLPTLPAVLGGEAPVWLVEGAKKALAVSQLGLAAVGFEGVEAWHTKGTTALLEDFIRIPLTGRLVELAPDGDVQTNPAVAQGIKKLADALQARRARVRLRLLPLGGALTVTQEVPA